MNRNKVFGIYLAFVALLGMSFAVIITYRFGAGLSTDGARYLSTAASLLEGNGFIEYLGGPLTQFPPLYSLLIAGLSLVTRMDVFVAAQYLNIAAFGLTIWLAGKFIQTLFPERLLYAYIASGIFATSPSLLRIASNVLSDLLFLAATLVFLSAASAYLGNATRKNLLVLGVVCAALPLLRYAGLAHIISISLIMLVVPAGPWIRRMLRAGTFGTLTGLPTLLWVYFHSYLQTGILFGRRLPPDAQGNLQTTLEKAVHWFVPYSVVDIVPEGLIVLGLAFLLVTGNSPARWKAWGQRLLEPNFLPNLAFFFVYLGVLVFNVSYQEVRWPFMDRIHIIILPSLLVLGFLTLQELQPFYLRRIPPAAMHTVTVMVCLVWLVYPLNNIQKYLRSAYLNGETSEYNLYNTRAQNEAGIREFVQSLNLTATDKIYSNYEPVAWLYTRRTILRLPQGPVNPEPPDPVEVLKKYPVWPGADGAGYVIWMKEIGFKEYVLAPDQLTSKADFTLLYTSDQGDVYRIAPK